MKNNNFYFYFYFYLILTVSCKSLNQEQLYGNYLNDEDRNTLISFNNKKFVITVRYKQLHMSPYSCCDTITYGDWSFLQKERFIILNNDTILSPVINVRVSEKTISLKDSVYIIIDNPIERMLKKDKEQKRDIQYFVLIESEDSKFGLSYSGLYDSNALELYNPQHFKILSIKIYVYPKYNFSGRTIGERFIWTLEYNIKDKYSNSFVIEMPKLSYQYMTYIRLKKEFMRVIDRNHLEWKGDIYSKQ